MDPAGDKFRILFDHSSDPHMIFADGGVTDCNEAMIRLLGCSCKEEVLRIHPAELSPPVQPDGRNSMEKSVEMDGIARAKGFHRFEWTHRKVTGEPVPVQVTLNAVTIAGKPSMVAVWHDLTELKRKESELRELNDKMKRDLRAAAVIQQSMLPTSSPLIHGMRAAWLYRPCEDLGGDILNVFKLDEHRAGFYVLDVTGHGVAASLLSVAASHFLSPHSEASFIRKSDGVNGSGPACPADVLGRLNQHFAAHPEQTQFFTLFYGILDVRSRELHYACAGHPAPLIISADGRFTAATGSDMPVGLTPEAVYAPRRIQLKKGDRVYVYSDGVTEARRGAAELWGEGRLADLLARSIRLPVAESLEAVLSGVEGWSRPAAPDDDITLLAIEQNL